MFALALDKNDIELLRQMMTEVSREVSREVCGERIDRLTGCIDDLSENTLANTLYIIKNASGKNPSQAQ